MTEISRILGIVNRLIPANKRITRRKDSMLELTTYKIVSGGRLGKLKRKRINRSIIFHSPSTYRKALVFFLKGMEYVLTEQEKWEKGDIESLGDSLDFMVLSEYKLYSTILEKRIGGMSEDDVKKYIVYRYPRLSGVTICRNAEVYGILINKGFTRDMLMEMVFSKWVGIVYNVHLWNYKEIIKKKYKLLIK